MLIWKLFLSGCRLVRVVDGAARVWSSCYLVDYWRFVYFVNEVLADLSVCFCASLTIWQIVCCFTFVFFLMHLRCLRNRILFVKLLHVISSVLIKVSLKRGIVLCLIFCARWILAAQITVEFLRSSQKMLISNNDWQQSLWFLHITCTLANGTAHILLSMVLMQPETYWSSLFNNYYNKI